MKVVWKQWMKDKKACCWIILWLILSTAYEAISAKKVIQISTTVMEPENWQQNLTILIGLSVAGMILSSLTGWFRPMATHHCFTTLSNNFADKVIDSDVDMFTEHSCSFVISMAEYNWSITQCGTLMVRCIDYVATLFITLFSIYLVGGNVIVPILIINFVGAILCKYLFKKYAEIDEEADKIKRKRNQEMEDIINGFAEVRSFGTQEHHRSIIRKLSGDVYKGREKRSKVQMVTSFSFDLVETLGLVAILIYSHRGIQNGTMTIAAAMALVTYVFRICHPIGNLIDSLDTISDLTARAKSYEKIINYRDPEPDGTIAWNSFDDGIELKDVSFSYDDSNTVLQHVSMKFPKGKKIGICGTTGVGKSTLFKLLNRFYREKSGEILIDGINIHDITRSSYCQHVGSVHQENTIFPGTIRQNILYGNYCATEYEMIEACKNAKIFDFIQSLPDRFETSVGPRGLTLSGGQKQRIALARLFLRNPDIILLDEATSALDNQSETFIQEAIDALPDKTIITIAHRLSTIRNSDIIYVMGRHGVVEQGTHEELMALKGVYYSMNK